MKRTIFLLWIGWSFHETAAADELLIPTIEGTWISIAGNPDLGEFTSKDRQGWGHIKFDGIHSSG